MASNYTSNYGLCQWEATDQVLREEFNEDNIKVDATLNDHFNNLFSLAAKDAVLENQIGLCGNCRILYGNYTGTGTYGSIENGCTLTFLKQPLAIFVTPSTRTGSENIQMMLIQGANWSFSEAYNQSTVTVCWDNKTVTWYHYNNASFQLNTNGVTYLYVAFIATDK
ncbi:hypothetical protein [Flintibacter sp. KGMB00164]|uniref:hypothetical protein n=1 Tax=Flintibacter sp. KGMB00164 TaxID=2610895 RepID=UPI001247F446|nr:hypothetical protein [Flintibacter sp. KGMB00164]